jgi:hypothetical protein
MRLQWRRATTPRTQASHETQRGLHERLGRWCACDTLNELLLAILVSLDDGGLGRHRVEAQLLDVWLEGEKGVHEARTGDWVASTCNVVHLTDARERANVGLAPRAHRGPTYTHRTGSIASHLTADIIVRCDGTEQCVH